jgi:hypothetical protein
VRNAARADLATVREESKAALERETRLMRDLRDQAQLEADRLSAELKDARHDADDAALRYRALQLKSDAAGSSLAAELKIKAADADRAQVRRRTE